ncbi:hypothetical protein LIA77_04459 [Sarocladium implicatum]|nr:hypothetical protein LIA77_04459 [Sarocladium implicatum]
MTLSHLWKRADDEAEVQGFRKVEGAIDCGYRRCPCNSSRHGRCQSVSKEPLGTLLATCANSHVALRWTRWASYLGRHDSDEVRMVNKTFVPSHWTRPRRMNVALCMKLTSRRAFSEEGLPLSMNSREPRKASPLACPAVMRRRTRDATLTYRARHEYPSVH